MTDRMCSIIEDGVPCGRPVKAFGWCTKHYHRYQRHRDPLITLKRRVDGPPEERFWAKVNKDGPIPSYAPELGPCWLWTGGTRRGYGRFGISHGQHVGAHCYGYLLQVGPVDPGLQLDHLCRVRLCVRASHLEPVTGRENILRSPIAPPAINARKTHCKRGHLFSEANTYIDSRGGRECRMCKYLQGKGLL